MRKIFIQLSLLIGVLILLPGNWGNTQGMNIKSERVRMVLQDGHGSSIDRITWSPDGVYLATGSSDGAVRLWLKNGILVNELKGHSGPVSLLEWSRDSKRLIVGTYNSGWRSIRTWQVGSQSSDNIQMNVKKNGHSISAVAYNRMKEIIAIAYTDKSIRLFLMNGTLLKELVGHSKPVYLLSWSPNGNILASGNEHPDAFVRLWSSDGNLLHELKSPPTVSGLNWSPDGGMIAVRNYQNMGSIYIWSSNGILVSILHKVGEFGKLVWSPDGRMLATSGMEHNQISLWLPDGTLIKKLIGHNAYADALAWSPDGQVLATGSHDSTIKFWRSDGSLVSSYTWGGFPMRNIHALAWNPTSRLLASGSQGDSILIWSRDGDIVNELKANKDWSKALSLNLDPGLIASGDVEGKVIKLRHLDGSVIHQWVGNSSVGIVSLGPDGKQIASAEGYIESIICVSSKDGRVCNKELNNGLVTQLAWSPIGNMFASSSVYGHKNIKIWRSDLLLQTDFRGHVESKSSGGIQTVKWNPQGDMLASLDFSSSVIVWKPDGKIIARIKRGRVTGIAWSPDGKTIVAASVWDKTVSVWRFDGMFMGEFQTSGFFRCMDWSPDGSVIATGHDDGTIYFYKLTDRTLTSLKGHTGSIRSLKWSGDGWLLASGAEDSMIHVWNADGTIHSVLKAHANTKFVDWTARNKMLVSFSDDYIFRYWNITSGGSVSVLAFKDGSWFHYDTFGRIDCSPGGEKHIKFVKGLTPYEPDQFWKKFHTPRLMKRFMNGEKFAPIDINDYVPNAPKVAIVSPSESYREHKDETITIRVKAEPAKNGLGDVFLYHNGRVLDHKSKGVSVKVTGAYRDFTVALLPGQANAFVGGAYDRDGNAEGRSGELVVYYKPGVVIKPDMYVLAVGVSDYQTKSIRLVSPSADARSIANAFKDISGSLYGNCHAEVLTDGAATREGILRKFKELSARIKNTDTVILYFSGHGITRKGNYYFLPHDAKLDDLGGTSISVDHIENFIAGQYGNKVAVFLDTCQSGSVTGRLSQLAMAKSVEEQVIIAQLARQRGMLVFTAAGGSSDAYDVKGLGNSIFTYCLIDALKNRRDRIRDDKNLITITKLMAEVKAMVPGVSKKYLSEEQLPDFWGSRHDFAVGK